MPSASSVVQFKYGLQSNYNLIEAKDTNTVYFCTDSQRMFVGDVEYTRPVQHGIQLPEGYVPPNSFFYHETEKALYYSEDGSDWKACSNFYTHPSFTSRTLGPQDDSTLTFGGTFTVPGFTVNEQGHVTAGEDHTFTMPSAPAIPDVEVSSSGSGNAVTNITADGHTITVTKGATFATSAELEAVEETANNAMPKSGGAFTGAVTVQAPTANMNPATKQYTDTQDADTLQQAKDYADSVIGANDAMVFKGTLGTGGTVTALPTTYSTGWTYRVITAGTYAGQQCEVGDLIIAIADATSSGTNADWTVAQTNIDGAVTHTSALTSGRIIVGGGNGVVSASTTQLSDLATAADLDDKVDKTTTVNGQPLSGNVNVTTITGNAGTATKLQTPVNINGVAFDGSEDITIPTGPDTLEGLTDVTLSDPANNQALLYSGTDSKWKNTTLNKSLVGLGNVDNTSDATKSVASAAKLTTARNINVGGVLTGTAASFDGTGNATINVTAVTGSGVTGTVASATKATQDGSGNVITTTYATKAELSNSTLTWGTF